MILRPVRPASPSGPPITNLPVGLTCQAVALGQPALGQHRADMGLDHLAHVGRGHVLVEMLGREHQARHLDRLAVGIAQRQLRLGVRPEPRLGAALAHLGQAAQDGVGVVDRRGHQLRRLVDGVAEHDALVARALFLAVAGVDALGDVRGLAVDVVVDLQGLPVEALLLVADVAHALAHDVLDAGRARRSGPRTSPPTTTRSVVAKVSQATRASGSLGQEGVEHGVGDPVADLVGMPFGHRLGGEDIVAAIAHPAPRSDSWRRLPYASGGGEVNGRSSARTGAPPLPPPVGGQRAHAARAPRRGSPARRSPQRRRSASRTSSRAGGRRSAAAPVSAPVPPSSPSKK